jgi:hypothetical protein
MSFGQSAPSASPKQIAYLLSLVKQAGHDGFRDARGPLGLTQRQAAGKFSKSEASTLIDLLLNGEGSGDDGGAYGSRHDGSRHDSSRHDSSGVGGGATAISGERISATERLALDRADLLRGMPAELLAGELERRGWAVTAP